MSQKTEKKRLDILRILKETDKPLSGSKISKCLSEAGLETNERTVRLYLLDMDREGLTVNFGKRGRMITEQGRKELGSAKVFEKVGMLAAKIDRMTYRMNFNISSRQGDLVINLSLIPKKHLMYAAGLIKKVFAAGYAFGNFLTISPSERNVGVSKSNEGMVGVCTVCSITLNGVFIAHGIPVHSRFGGLLELRDGKPWRFVELIHYEGTTIDPLEIFIKSGMTDYTGAIKTGSGLIGVSFREVPAESRDMVVKISRMMDNAGLGCIMSIGWPGQPLLDIPVSEGRIGVIVVGGLNPIAILEEKGIRISHTGAMTDLVDYRNLFHYRELESRFKEILMAS